MTEQDRKQINILIKQISEGNVFALDGLSRLVSGRMLSVAMSVVKNRSLAEDVVQESFLKILNNSSKFRPDTNGYAWICKIVQNQSLNMLRKENRMKTENVENFFDISDDDDLYEKSTSAMVLKNAMGCLDNLEKRLIYEKYFMDFTVRDSAKSVGKSKSTVQRVLQKAEEKLQKAILQKGFEV